MLNRIAVGLLGLCLVAFLSACQSRPALPHDKLSLDKGWRFHAEDGVAGTGVPAGLIIERWRWCPEPEGAKAADLAAVDLKTDGPAWHDAAPGEDTFHGRVGFSWYRAVLPPTKGHHRLVQFDSVDDNATVYLNGVLLGQHEGWNDTFEIELDQAWHKDGPNVLAVRVENTAGAGGIGRTTLQDDTQGAAGQSLAAANFDDRTWRQVDVPHDFVIEGGFDPKSDRNHGYRPGGIGWYRRTVFVPAGDQGRRLWLEFDGVYRNSKVWVNGHLAGQHASGYTSFRYDITDLVHYGQKNVIAVRADAAHFEGWWYEGGGIYRHVYLTETEPLHVQPWGVFVKPQVSNVGDGVLGTADVAVETTVENQGATDSDLVLHSVVMDGAGHEVGRAQTLQFVTGNGTVLIPQKIRAGTVQLWSCEHPTLYKLITTVERDGRTLDRVETSFGFRTIRYDVNAGFFLNGQPVKIKGTCNHQDFAGVGVALPDRLHEYKVQKLREMGSNGFRYSHQPMAPELLDACDRQGMLVMDENRKLGDSAEILGQVDSLVRRDRNHPCIVIWSLCNEEGLQGTPAGEKMGRAMKAIVDRLDGTRPVTAAMNGGWGAGLTNVVDIQGFNYYPDHYTPFHQTHPNQPIIATETASVCGTRGIYQEDRPAGYVSAYNSGEGSWRPVADRPFVSGAFVWTGFDYRGEPTPFDWPCINSHFGIMDTCGFPKDDYYYYQSWWSNKTVLHLLPHWNWAGQKQPGEKIDVRCYSNCAKVELFLNGKSLGTKEMPPESHLDWQVGWEPGVLSAKGFAKDGKEIAATSVETTGPVAGIKLAPDRTVLKADGEDCVLVGVAIVDAQGRTVPLAANEVQFAVKGPGKIIGVGNGDPSCHDPDKTNHRKAFKGLCLLIVQTTESAGTVEITATAPGLAPAHVTVQSQKSALRAAAQ